MNISRKSYNSRNAYVSPQFFLRKSFKKVKVRMLWKSLASFNLTCCSKTKKKTSREKKLHR